MYTVGEIKEAINEDFDGSWNEFMELIDYGKGSYLESLNVYASEVSCGGESSPWSVFKIGNQFFKITGSHDSWNGTEWDGALIKVRPIKRTVTDYEGF
jgi:hypothetical protein